MKKRMTAVLILSILIMSRLNLFAQKTNFALSVGYCSAFYTTASDASTSSDFKDGFYAGTSLRVAMGKHWHFEPGLLFVQKGGIEEGNPSETEVRKSTVKLNYLEMPLNFVYSRRDLFFFGFGPSLGFALSGKQILEYDSREETYKIKFGNNADEGLKRVDIGLTLLVGLHLSDRLFCRMDINTSFNNISNYASEYFSNGYGGISLGYIFETKKKKN